MASLVGAVYKGTTKAASATMGATYSKVAGQIPTPTRAIYNLGLGVGPLLESIVSEMSRGKPSSAQSQQNEANASKATAEGLRLVAVQISSLSSIMSDLRNIALMQLKENKASNQRLRQLEVQRKFGEQEDIIEKIRAPLSSLAGPAGPGKTDGKGLDLIPALGMVKTGLAVALSAFLVDKFLPETSKAIKESVIDAYNSVAPGISQSVKEALNKALDEVPGLGRLRELFNWLNDLDKQLRGFVGDKAVDSALTGLLAGSVISLVLRRFGIKNAGKLALGAAAAVTGANLFGDEEMGAAETAITAGQGVAATALGLGATSAAKRMFGKKDDAIDADGKVKPGPVSVSPPSATIPPPANLSPGQTGQVAANRAAANDPTKMKESVYQKLKRDTVPKLQAVLKKIPLSTFVKIAGTRLGVVAASTMAASIALGPLGMILAAISLSVTAYSIIELVDFLYDSLTKTVDSASKPAATSLAQSPELDQKPQALALSKPGISDQNTPVPTGAPFDLERYMNTVAMRESGNKMDAKNPLSSASGKFQFLRGTFEGSEGRTGIRDLDPRLKGVSFEEFNKREDLQNIAMKILTNMNYDFLRDRLGREPTEEEMYLAHFLGAKGANDLIRSAEKGEAVSSAVSSKVMMANPNMFPSGSESSRDVLKRITGYYTKGKVSKVGEPSSLSLESTIPFDKNNVATQVDAATKKIAETSTTLSQSVYSSLQGIMDALSGNFSMDDGKSTSTEFTSSGPAATADASANEPTSREKDKLLFYAADSGYYGRR